MQSVDLGQVVPIDVASDWHLGNDGCPTFLVKDGRAIEIVFNECLSVKNYLSTMVRLIVKGASLELPVRLKPFRNLKIASIQGWCYGGEGVRHPLDWKL